MEINNKLKIIKRTFKNGNTLRILFILYGFCIFLYNCRPTFDLSACDPASEVFRQSLALKLAFNDPSGEVCGYRYGRKINPNLKVFQQNPASGLTSVSRGTGIELTFSEKMSPETLTSQSTAGTCSGSVQVSFDDFASCIEGNLDLAQNPKITFNPSKILRSGTQYKLRVTTDALNEQGERMASNYTSSGGFGTSGAWAFVSNYQNSQIWLFTMDPNTGLLQTRTTVFVNTTSGVSSMAIHPSGKFLFATMASEITTYRIDTSSGDITFASTYPVPSPSKIVVEPAGKFAFATGAAADTIYYFKIDPVTGALSPNIVPGLGASTSPQAICLNPAGNSLFVSMNGGGGILFFGLDSTGIPSARSNTPYAAGSVFLKTDPTGEHLYSVNNTTNNVDLFTIDYTNGLLLAGGAYNTMLTQPTSIDFDPAGKFAFISNYASATTNIVIPTRNSSGVLNVWGSAITSSMGTQNVILDSSGKYAFSTESTGNVVNLYTVDTINGSVSPNIPNIVGAGPGNPGPYAILIY
ncbi:beta-propeller fold lactonase family protein [Leptospira sp. FAT2]|uniref:beta-propeller fold lactonase family protein n=1 Tax=Leptospira sanjuanensis TaxID=2879643 RepID=UPI001EE84B53|nr:beta-propeller fold lactonase family protein [Leptospira sanjuanensis]MCG6192738.1 beta-propeller fold lactonase family protein [Leptospira sanjuanensis]